MYPEKCSGSRCYSASERMCVLIQHPDKRFLHIGPPVPEIGAALSRSYNSWPALFRLQENKNYGSLFPNNIVQEDILLNQSLKSRYGYAWYARYVETNWPVPHRIWECLHTGSSC